MASIDVPVTVTIDCHVLREWIARYSIEDRPEDPPTPRGSTATTRWPEAEFSHKSLVAYVERAMLAAYIWYDKDLTPEDAEGLHEAALNFVVRTGGR
jgi:hypothetical protein